MARAAIRTGPRLLNVTGFDEVSSDQHQILRQFSHRFWGRDAKLVAAPNVWDSTLGSTGAGMEWGLGIFIFRAESLLPQISCWVSSHICSLAYRAGWVGSCFQPLI